MFKIIVTIIFVTTNNEPTKKPNSITILEFSLSPRGKLEVLLYATTPTVPAPMPSPVIELFVSLKQNIIH